MIAQSIIAENRSEILRIAEERGIHSIRIFGSVARREDDQDSDLDLVWQIVENNLPPFKKQICALLEAPS